MTTATTETPTVPAATETPKEPSLADELFGSTSAPPAAPPEEQTPAATPVPDSTPAEKPAETPPEQPKHEEPPKGTEDPVEAAKKEAAAQRKANARLGKEVAELKRQNEEVVNELKRLRGEPDEKPPTPTPEEIAKEAVWRDREKSSRLRANELFGEQAVTEQIYGVFDEETGQHGPSPYKDIIQKKPWIHVEVTQHPQPAVRAVQLLKREAFFEQYGDDPTQWEAKVIEAAKPKLLEDFKKQVTQTPTGRTPPSVSDGRPSSGSTPKDGSLADMLYGKS